MDVATNEEKDKTNIFGNTKPNIGRLSFIFQPESHLLVHEIQDKKKHISPKQMETFLNGIFSETEILDKFGIVNITIPTEPESVERMPSLKGITLIMYDYAQTKP